MHQVETLGALPMVNGDIVIMDRRGWGLKWESNQK